MSTAKERKQNDYKVDYLINEACGDDQAAKEYLQLIAYFSRVTDDVADEPETVSQNQLMALIEILFIRIPSNLFYRKNQDLLFSQHVAMWNAWEASNFLNKGDFTDQIYAHVLRDYVNELFMIVALLTQGHDKMKEINGSIRGLFKKKLGE